MRFVIKPADDSFDMMLEAGQYQRIWRDHSATIQNAFKKLTGLEFQQRHITAKVNKGSCGNAGYPGQAMILPGDYTAEDFKTCTLMHELAHRLLGGNALGPVSLGLIPDEDKPHPQFPLYEHRHIYLFLYDSIKEAFGDGYAERCIKNETDLSPTYDEAWNWAMGMSPTQRQRAVKLLADEALPRSRWHERNNLDEIPPKNPSAWFEKLTSDY